MSSIIGSRLANRMIDALCMRIGRCDYREALRRIDASDDPRATLASWLARENPLELPPHPDAAWTPPSQPGEGTAVGRKIDRVDPTARRGS